MADKELKTMRIEITKTSLLKGFSIESIAKDLKMDDRSFFEFMRKNANEINLGFKQNRKPIWE